MWIVFVIVGLINCRLLQRDSPSRGGPPKGQHQSTLDEIFTYVTKNLDQDQQSKLENVQMYIFEEGLKYYAQANKEQQTKMLASFVGMIGELEKQSQSGEQKIEQDIKYFSSLSKKEQDMILTIVSQSLKKQLEDSTKTFNSATVLSTIENEIEQFQKQPNTNIISTWNTTQFEQKEKDLQFIEYQIQEFFDQGLNNEQIKQNISNFINQFLTNSTSIDKNGENLQELIEKVTEKDQNQDSTAELKELRQKVRLYIRDLLKQGKTEQEVEQLVEKFITENGIETISEEDKQRIKRVIHKEFMRYERQKEFLKAAEDQNKDQDNDDNDDKPVDGTVQNTSVSLVVIIIGILGAVTIIGFLVYIVRRQVMKIKINSGRQQAGFSNPDLGQDIEQME